jgi:hypothetical protein
MLYKFISPIPSPMKGTWRVPVSSAGDLTEATAGTFLPSGFSSFAGQIHRILEFETADWFP